MAQMMEVTKTVKVDVPDLGARIRQARMAKVQSGARMTSIADAAGMSVQNWYRIEKERQSLPIETLRLIEKALDFDFGVEFDE